MRYGVSIALAAALVAAIVEAQKAPSAVTGLRPAAQATPAQKAQIDALRTQRGAGVINIAKVSAKLVRDTGVGKSLAFLVTPSDSVEARAVAVEKDGPRLLWRGEISTSSAGLPPGLATLVISGEGVTGSIRTSDGRLFRLRPLSGGETAIIQMDYATMPEDHPPDSPGDKPQAARKTAPVTVAPGAARRVQQAVALDTATVKARLASKPDLLAAATGVRQVSVAERFRLRGDWWRFLRPPTIDLLVAYTSSAQTAAGDIASLISLAVTESNDSFTNSNVWARVNLVGTMAVTYSEAGKSFLQMVNDLQGSSDGAMDTIHTQRNTLRADVVVLIINNGAYCGRAYDIGVSADGAFCVVHWDCATGYYSFAHEIAHLVGCRHDRDNDATATPFAWAHGFRHKVSAAGWRTIMGYKCSSNLCDPRLQYWSSPLTTWGGTAMGTADLEDNHRVWNERAATVAAFR